MGNLLWENVRKQWDDKQYEWQVSVKQADAYKERLTKHEQEPITLRS